MGDRIETVEERVVYRNSYATVWDDLVRFPDGRQGTYFRWRWNAPHGVGVVPVQGEDVILIKNYRYQNQDFSIEIPQGFGEEGAEPVEDAARELLEETGLMSNRLSLLLKLDEGIPTFVFVAEIDPDSLPTERGMENTESISAFIRCPIERISPDYLRELGISGAMTTAALLALRLSAS